MKILSDLAFFSTPIFLLLITSLLAMILLELRRRG